MYTIKKRIVIEGMHSLDLPYASPCCRQHGHSWHITVIVKGHDLNKEGMLIDFSKIKEVVMELDHNNLNNYIIGNPTAENIATYIADRVQQQCPKDVWIDSVSVQETEGNIAVWER